jgi:Tfp pilus assembly protein PilX
MSRRLRNETGSTLIAAVLVVFIMLAFGLALLAATDTQSKTSAHDRTRESSFNLAEAAMNAHVLQLTRPSGWPTVANAPSACDPTSGANATCPQPAALQGAYTGGDYGTTPCATSSAPAWQTMVRDSQGEQYWNASYATTRVPYDQNGDGVVWLRSQATTQCHTIAVVSQVAQNQVPIAFPQNVVTANWFQTTNKGKKVIVDTRGSGSQPAAIVTRCSGLTTAQCLNYPADKGQVQPPAVRADSNGSSTTLTDAQLQALKAQAQASGSYYAGCPSPVNSTTLSSPANGAPVYVANCPVLSIGSNTQVNSAAKPGALIIENGTLELGGTSSFYGLIYMANKQGSSGAVVTIGGSAQIWGIVSIDGLGGLVAGSSKTNLINDPRAATLLRGAAGAVINKNTFRIVPTS